MNVRVTLGVQRFEKTFSAVVKVSGEMSIGDLQLVAKTLHDKVDGREYGPNCQRIEKINLTDEQPTFSYVNGEIVELPSNTE